MLVGKIIIGSIIVIFLGFLLSIVCNYIINLVDAIYSRECLIETMDQVIRLFKYQQILLADINIPVRFTLSRALFTDNILEVYRYMNSAYTNDVDKALEGYSEEHAKSTRLSYEDNVNSINLYLSEYNAFNVRYSVDRDSLPILNRFLPEYKFLDSDVTYTQDNGIEGTAART